MRALIYGLTALAVAFGLLLFEDVDAGLPLVNMIVWPTAALAGLLVLLRSAARRQRRSSKGRSYRVERNSDTRLLTHKSQPRLPRR